MENSQLNTINDILKEKSFVQNKGEILKLIKDPQLARYFFKKLPANFSDIEEVEY